MLETTPVYSSCGSFLSDPLLLGPQAPAPALAPASALAPGFGRDVVDMVVDNFYVTFVFKFLIIKVKTDIPNFVQGCVKILIIMLSSPYLHHVFFLN